MRSFQFTGLAKSEAVKLVGHNCVVKFDYTGATSLICYVKAGFSDTTMAEIVNSDGDTVTRFTASGTGSQLINISGLTPGSFVAIDTVSGTGTVVGNVLTGQE